MPTISLRLTEEEHAELKAWAHDGRRSVQKEIIWRLFSNTDAPAKYAIRDVAGRTITTADAQPRDVRARTLEPDPHFKPDPKS